jgi:hypothetical protein
MSSRKTFIRLFSFLLIISVSFAQPRQDYQPEWDAMIKDSPSVEGSLFYPLATPCPLFSLEGTTQGEPMALMARGDDLSQQGGSASGCGIPDDATALMIQLRVESPVNVPVQVKLWPTEGLEPVESVVDSPFGSSVSTMVVVPSGRLDPSHNVEFQVSISNWAVLEGQVVGYFRPITPASLLGGGFDYYTENDTKFNNFFGTIPVSNTGWYNSFFGGDAGFDNTSGSFNVFLGFSAGKNNTTGDGNTAIGNSALRENETGFSNTAVGDLALTENKTVHNTAIGASAQWHTTTGSKNTAVGSGALQYNETGDFNCAVGYRSLFMNEADDNTALGSHALGENTSGENNTAVGKAALYTNQTGRLNTAIGHEAGSKATGDYNTFSGSQAGYGATSGVDNTGDDNTFLGFQCGYHNTTGNDNVFVGKETGYANQTGQKNTAVGQAALYSNQTGWLNTVIGQEAGYNATGKWNVFTGYRAGYGGTSGVDNTGENNTFLGLQAGYKNTTGNENAFLGFGAGYSNTTGFGNSFFGAWTDGAASVTNATAIGYRARVNQSNSLVLGSIAGVNNATVSVDVGIGTTAPLAPLHVSRSDSTVKIILAESTGPEAVRNMMDLKNNGMAQFRLIDTSPNGDAWQFSNTDNNLNISLQGSGSQEFLIENDGDVWINNGTIMVTSYRASKANFRELDTEEILRRVADLPLSDWNYRKDADTVRHIGPVSEDFYEAFGYGEDDQHISPNDLAGVNTAAIQELYRQNLQLKGMLVAKIREMEDLKIRLTRLEKLDRGLAEVRE